MSDLIHCIIVDDEPIAREILESHLSKISSVHVAGSCKNALEAFNMLNAHSVDLIFLDINMPEISGLSFAKSLTKDIKIIFTTAYREYAVDGFDLQAVDYLLKPISFERLLQAINKFQHEQTSIGHSERKSPEEEKPDAIFVRADRKMVRIDFSAIVYIESIGDYIKIFLKDKTVVSRETLSNIEASLPQKDFIRIHRSYIIALDSIVSYTNESIEVQNNELPISRSYRNEVLDRLK